MATKRHQDLLTIFERDKIHLHLHGIMPDQIAASVTQRGAYLKEDC